MQLIFTMAPKSKAEKDQESRKNHSRDSDEYRLRRERNNMAVKKSREKSRSKVVETSVRVETLKKENDELEGKVSMLTKELSLLKELLLSSAAGKRKPSNDEHKVNPNSQSKASFSVQLLRQLVPDKTYNNTFLNNGY